MLLFITSEPLFVKAKEVEAKEQLTHLLMLEKGCFYEHSTYSKELSELLFEQQKLTVSGGNTRYKIEIINASPTGFKARATSVEDFDNDGVYNQWEIDQEQHLVETIED